MAEEGHDPSRSASKALGQFFEKRLMSFRRLVGWSFTLNEHNHLAIVTLVYINE